MKPGKRMQAMFLGLAAVLKAAQRVCLPLIPNMPLTVAQLTGEGIFLLFALGMGLGAVACVLDLTGREFACLYGRCAVMGILCRTAGLLFWQWLGLHWVWVLYVTDAGILLLCAWQIRLMATGLILRGAKCHLNLSNMPELNACDRSRVCRWLTGLMILLVAAGVQGFVWSRCRWFREDTDAYRLALDLLALPMGAGEWVLLLGCCWLLLPAIPQSRRSLMPGSIGELSLWLCIIGLCLYGGLVKPEGFVDRLRHTAHISYEYLDGSVEERWQIEEERWRVERHRDEKAREGLYILRLRDEQGRRVGGMLLTEPLEVETRMLEGQSVQMLHPYGLLLPVDDTLRLVRLADLPDQPEEPLLTAFCRACLTDFRWFGGCAGYLAQVDPAFVQPYLERYAAGRFTPEEVAAMGDIRPERIAYIARRLLVP